MISRLAYNKISRLKKKILAEWTQINMSDPDLIQYITDAMTYNYPVQINYEGSGWRTIQPYGWNSSKQQDNGTGNNILLMCYKDTGEIRSYRLDKISDIYIDYDNQVSVNNNDQMQQEQIYEDLNNEQNNLEDIDMPTLPENDNDYNNNPNIYNEELSILENDDNEKDENNKDDKEENVNEQ